MTHADKRLRYSFFGALGIHIVVFCLLAMMGLFAINNRYYKNTWTYWFMMQVAKLVGFFFAYPTNAILIKLGIKKGMYTNRSFVINNYKVNLFIKSLPYFMTIL